MRTLAAMLDTCLQLWQEGAAGAQSPWRNPALATVSAGPGRGVGPGVRIVVLRRFDPDLRIAELHTDARSPKLLDLAANPHAALHGWDPCRRVQMRLDGVIERADSASEQHAWDALHEGSRATYAAPLAPGTPMPGPEPVNERLDHAAARQNFRVLQLRFDSLEYLSLEAQPHCRALFRWSGGGHTATWLAP